MAIAWTVSFKTPEEKKAFLDAKPFTYVGSLLVSNTNIQLFHFIHSTLLLFQMIKTGSIIASILFRTSVS